MGWLERRLDAAQAEQHSEVARRFDSFEQADRRFKDWVQREYEQLHGQLQQVQAVSMDGQQQQQRHVAGMTAHTQKLELRLQELEAAVAQTTAQSQALSHALQAERSSAEGASTAALDIFRAELEREVAARSALAVETTEKVRDLHGMLAQVHERHEQEALGRQQQLAEHTSQRQARFAHLEPDVEALRADVEALREQLRRTGSDCTRRCEDAEAACAQRIAGVQESALTAARELWEEHQGIVVECKTSMTALQQILDAKDNIAAQLQSLQQQQREDDKRELLNQLTQGHEGLRNQVAALESALGNEHGARLEAQQQAEALVSRLGLALEKAQAGWLKDSEQLAAEIRGAQRQVGQSLDDGARGWERRLAEAVDAMQRRVAELGEQASVVRTGLGLAQDRLAELARRQEAELGTVEGRLKRQISDMETVHAGKVSQCDFDLRASMRTALAEQAERLQAEISRAEQDFLRQGQKHEQTCSDLTRQAEALEERMQGVMAAAEARASARLAEELNLERERSSTELQRVAEEERSARLQAETERLGAQQRRFAAHEELTAQRLEEFRVRQDDVHATHRQSVEAQALKDRQDLQRLLEEAAAAQQTAKAAADAELARFGITCAKLEAELKEMKEKLQAELAAFGARFAVSLATNGSEQRLRLEAAEARLNEVLAESTGARAALRTELEARITGLEEALTGVEAVGVTARTELGLALDAATEELGGRLEARSSALEARTNSLEERAGELEEAVEGLEGRLEERAGGLAAELQAAMQEERAAAQADAAEVADGLQQVRQSLHDIEEDTLRRFDEIAEKEGQARLQEDMMMGNVQRQIGEVGVQLAAHKQAQAEALAETRRELEEALAQEEVRAQQAEQDLQKRADEALAELAGKVETSRGEQEAALLQEEARAQEAEVELRRQAEEAAAKLAAEIEAVREEVSVDVETLRDEQQVALHQEEARAQEAEGAFQQRMEDTVAELGQKVHSVRYELESALSREEDRAEASEMAVRSQIESLESAVRAEEGRAQAAERELEGQFQALRADQEQAVSHNENSTQAAQVELQQQLEEQSRVHSSERAAERAALDEQLQQLEQRQRQQAEDGEQAFRTQLEALKGEHEQALRAEEQRAGAVEAELRQQLAAQEALRASSDAELRALLQGSAEEQQVACAELRQQLEAANGSNEQGLAALREQLEQTQAAHVETAGNQTAELLRQVEDIRSQQAQAQEAMQERAQAEVAAAEEHSRSRVAEESDIRQRLEAAEQASAQLAEDARALRALQDQRHTEHVKLHQDAQVRQDAVGDDIELLGRRLEELAAQGEASARVEERQEQGLAELAGLQEKLGSVTEEQEKLKEAVAKASTDLETRSGGLEEQMGSLVLSTAEIMGKFESLAPAEELAQLSARVEGGFSALVVRLESERWMRENIDKVADTVANSFLRLLDETSQKLGTRLDKCEQRLSHIDAG